MKKLNKIMSVGLSLALCAGMVAPAFAENAYFYGELTQEQIDQIKASDEDFDAYRTKNSGSGGWVFLGKGDTGDTETSEIITTDENGTKQLAEGVTAPQPDEDSADGTQTVHTTQEGNVTVKPFHDLGEYKYDDGSEGSEVGQYSYTVEWSDAKRVDTGATLQGTETTDGGPNEKIVISGSNTINVDGKIKLHENAQLTVKVQNHNKDAETVNDSTYVRDTQKGDEAKVESIAGTLAGVAKDCYEFAYDEESTTATYKEKTYTVTYVADSRLGFDGEAGDYGKATQEWTDAMLKAALADNRGLGGTYVFNGWSYSTDEDGNVTVTAQCTFIPDEIPAYVDIPTVEIDDPAVPLASGPVTRAEFIDYLWRHEGEPASDGVCTFTDVAADHEFILALAWAEQNGLAEAYEDGTFQPDELVTVAAVRDILDNFADVFGTNVVAADDLTTLTGEEDEAVLNCDEVLAEFFGEEYTPAEVEDDIAA